jgi:prepilin-type processing-associated H-X9-DG protein
MPAKVGNGQVVNNPVIIKYIVNTTGWVLMLPFIEQSAAFNQYSFNNCSSGAKQPVGSGGPTAPVLGVETVNNAICSAKYSFLECPSHPDAGELRTNLPGTNDPYSMLNARRTSYFFSSAQYDDGTSPYQNLLVRRLQAMGAFGNDGAARFEDMQDGTSNVIAIGESAGGKTKVDPNWGPWGLNGTRTCCHGRVFSSFNNTTLTPTPLQVSATDIRDNHINSAYQNDPQKRHFAFAFSSLHSGGAQFVFGDGSVRFLPETMDYLLLFRLACIADGETANGTDF